MKTELKPCPFCGGIVRFEKYGKFWAVKCPFCGTNSALKFLKEDAIKTWNRRTDNER